VNRFWLLLLACVGGVPGSLVGQRVSTPASINLHGSASALAQLFDSLGYQLDSVAASNEAPRVFASTLPGDMASMSPVRAKTDLFIRLLLPLALEANERIAAQRDSLLALQEKSGAWSAAESSWVSALANEYRGSADQLDQLLARVDVIPVSLALAQGADESAWGTSRFAREGNSLFGQHTHAKGEAGLVAGSGKKNVQVAAFPSLLDGVLAYAHNLNSNPAYAELRQVRAQERAQHDILSGSAVAEGLKSYSARGEDYVHTLQSIIRAHHLHEFDDASLKHGPGLAVSNQ
jgi:Bax protein